MISFIQPVIIELSDKKLLVHMRTGCLIKNQIPYKYTMSFIGKNIKYVYKIIFSLLDLYPAPLMDPFFHLIFL